MKTNLTSEEFFEKWKKAIEKVDGQVSDVDRDDEEDEEGIPLF